MREYLAEETKSKILLTGILPRSAANNRRLPEKSIKA
jgi:hypothetical protein